MAMIVFNQRYKGRLAQVVTAEKAKKIQAVLDNPPDNLTEDQIAYFMAIKKVYQNKGSMMPKTAQKASTRLIDDENNRLNIGVLQGKSEMLPRNDR